jgi:capsular polysaccharide biosynthesis protein
LKKIRVKHSNESELKKDDEIEKSQDLIEEHENYLKDDDEEEEVQFVIEVDDENDTQVRQLIFKCLRII